MYTCWRGSGKGFGGFVYFFLPDGFCPLNVTMTSYIRAITFEAYWVSLLTLHTLKLYIYFLVL